VLSILHCFFFIFLSMALFFTILIWSSIPDYSNILDILHDRRKPISATHSIFLSVMVFAIFLCSKSIYLYALTYTIYIWLKGKLWPTRYWKLEVVPCVFQFSYAWLFHHIVLSSWHLWVYMPV
jgi:hypothetical protein